MTIASLVEARAHHEHTHNPERGTLEEAFSSWTECESCGIGDGKRHSVAPVILGQIVHMTVCGGCKDTIEEEGLYDAEAS